MDAVPPEASAVRKGRKAVHEFRHKQVGRDVPVAARLQPADGAVVSGVGNPDGSPAIGLVLRHLLGVERRLDRALVPEDRRQVIG